MQQNKVANAIEDPSGPVEAEAEQAFDVVADHGGAGAADEPGGDVVAR